MTTRHAIVQRALTRDDAGVDLRVAWSAAAGVVTATCGTSAVAWAVGAAAPHSRLPVLPAYLFGGVALCGAYVTVAALLRIWPLHRLAIAPAQPLDDCIRLGMEARTRIVYDQLDDWEAAREAATWFLSTAHRLHADFPAISDDFPLASGDDKLFSGQALAVRNLAVKIAVLSDARRGLG